MNLLLFNIHNDSNYQYFIKFTKWHSYLVKFLFIVKIMKNKIYKYKKFVKIKYLKYKLLLIIK